MSNREIALAWERAKRLADNIWTAYITGVGIAQAKQDQKSLKVWLDLVRENGLVYNGSLDEFLKIKL